MSDSTVSALTAASLPLAGTELVPLVQLQGGSKTSVQAPVSALVSTAVTQPIFNTLLNSVVYAGAALDGTGNQGSVTRTAAYSGGTNGYVNSALRVTDNVTSSSAASYEWALLAILNNSALGTAGSQNVALVAQGNRMVSGASNTWAATLESQDLSGAVNPVYSQVGCEIDVWCNGADNNGVRLGLGIYAGAPPSLGGTAPTVNTGIYIGPVNGVAASGNYYQGIHLYGVMNRGISLTLTTGAAVGIDISGSTLTNSALRLADGQYIGFTATDNATFGHVGADSGVAYSVVSGGTTVLLDAGGVAVQPAAGSLKQIIGAQQTTAVAAATFVQVDTTTTVSTDSTFDGYTLRQVVKALRIHGLLA